MGSFGSRLDREGSGQMERDERIETEITVALRKRELVEDVARDLFRSVMWRLDHMPTGRRAALTRALEMLDDLEPSADTPHI